GTLNSVPSEVIRGTNWLGTHPPAAAGDLPPTADPADAGATTRTTITVRTEPSENASVNTPRRTPAESPPTDGCTTIRVGWFGATVPAEGRTSNQRAPSTVTMPVA